MPEAADITAFDHPGKAPAVLLLHGFTSTPWELRLLGAALAECGYACSAPLLPGHGETPEALSRTTWVDWAGAVDTAFDALRRRYRRVIVAGASLGALLAIDAAQRHADNGVAGIVTLAAALQLSPTSMITLRAARAMGAHLPNLYAPKLGGSDIRDLAAQRANPGYQTYPLRAAREFLTGQDIARRALPHLRAPLLAVHGLVDTTTPLDASLEVLRLFGGDDASLVVVPHSGHVLAVDLDHIAVARQVCAFVDRCAAATT